jgi:serine/threonine protein kinase/WD40 repeat protein/tetratricopeptide (TPR) repeat protein
VNEGVAMNERTREHPTIDELAAFHLGRLDENACAAIEAHLVDCPHCCDRLGELGSPSDPFLARLQALPGRDAGRPAMAPFSLAETVVGLERPSLAQRWPSLPGYEVLGELGRGGMGVVYKARQLRLGRVVALKMILAGAQASPADLVRLRREATIVARLRHPNLIQIYEIGEHDGRPYLALEYADGGSLAARVRGQPQPPRDSARLVEALARGVAAAHAQGIVHRDLKPANVLLQRKSQDANDKSQTRPKLQAPDKGPDPVGDCGLDLVCDLSFDSWGFEPKVTDFGLARSLDGEHGLTATGAIVGTPEYMAPEQTCPAGAILGPAVDVYALGVILYELLTGQPPFRAATVLETFQRAAEQEPVPPGRRQPGVPPDLDTICLKCLRKRAGERYASAGDLADDLRRFLSGEAIRARPVGALEHAWKWACRKPTLAVLLLTVLLTLLAGSGASTYFGIAASRRADDAERARESAVQLAADKAEALDKSRRARRDSDLRAAQLKFNAAIAECQSGAVARGLFTLLDAWRLAPPDEHELRRVIRLNLAAWQRHLPILVETFRVPRTGGGHVGVRLLGPAGETFAVWTGTPCRLELRDTTSGRPLGVEHLVLEGKAVQDINAAGTLLLARGKGPGAAHLRSSGLHRLPGGALIRDGIHYRNPKGNPTSATATGFTSSSRVVVARQPDANQPDWGLRRFWSIPDVRELPLSVTLGRFDGLHLVQDRAGRDVAVVFRSFNRLAGTVPVAEFWDTLTGQRLKSLVAPSGSPDPRLSWDGRTILGLFCHEWYRDSFPRDGFVARFDTATGQLAGPVWKPRRQARYLTLSGDGQSLATWGRDERVRLFDLGTGLQRGGDVATVGNGSGVFVSPEGSRLVMASDDVIRLWRIPERSLQATVAASLHSTSLTGARQRRVEVAAAVFSHDSEVILASAHRSQGLAWLVDAATGHLRGQPLRHQDLNMVAISPDGTRLATGTGPNLASRLRVWDARGLPLTPFFYNPTLIHALTFSPNGRTLAVAGVGGVFLWELDRRRMGHLYEDTCAGGLLFRPDGRQLAVAYKAGWTKLGAGFCLWDVTTGERVGQVVKIPSPHHARLVMAFTREAGGPANATPVMLRVFVPHNGACYTMDTSDGKLVGKPQALGPAENAVFSADGRLLATWYRNSRVRLFDRAGRSLEPAMSSAVPVTGLSFSPDGTILAARCQDGAVRLWDTATRLPLGPPLLHRSGVLAMRFSPSGRALVTITEAGTTTTLPLPEPVADDPDGAQRWLEVMSGVEMRGDEVVLLAPERWQEKKRRLADKAGPSVHETPADWYDRCATEAEEDGNTFAVLWHLERLAALRPNDWRVQARRGRALASAGDRKQAEAAYRLAAARPGAALADWYRQRQASCRALEEWNEALWYLDRLADVVGKDWQVDTERAEVHGRLGQWSEAVDQFARAGRPGAIPPRAHYDHALACLKASDQAGYRRICADWIESLPPVGRGLGPMLANSVAMACALGPDAVSTWAKPLALIEHALRWLRAARLALEQQQRFQSIRHALLNTHGAVLYRAGRYPDAVARLKESMAAHGKGGTVQDWLFLALAHHQMKQVDEARKWRDKVSAHKGPPVTFWDGVEMDLLRTEMMRTLDSPDARNPPGP